MIILLAVLFLFGIGGGLAIFITVVMWLAGKEQKARNKRG